MCAGMGRFLPQLPLANRSRAIWGRLNELLGEDAEFLPSGHIRIAYTPEMVERIETYAARRETLWAGPRD